MRNSVESIVAEFRRDRLGCFLSGFTSAFNLRGNIGFPDVSRGLARDAEALRGDWYKVGSDLWRTMGRVTADEYK